MPDLTRRSLLKGLLGTAAAAAVPTKILGLELATQADPEELLFYATPPELRKSYCFMPGVERMSEGGVFLSKGWAVRLKTGWWDIISGVSTANVEWENAAIGPRVTLRHQGRGHVVRMSADEWSRQVLAAKRGTEGPMMGNHFPAAFGRREVAERMVRATHAEKEALRAGGVLIERSFARMKARSPVDTGEFRSDWRTNVRGEDR